MGLAFPFAPDSVPVGQPGAPPPPVQEVEVDTVAPPPAPAQPPVQAQSTPPAPLPVQEAGISSPPEPLDTVCPIELVRSHLLLHPLTQGEVGGLRLPEHSSARDTSLALRLEQAERLYTGEELPKADGPIAERGVAVPMDGFSLGFLVIMVLAMVLVRLRFWPQYVQHFAFLFDLRSIRRSEQVATSRTAVFNRLGDGLYLLCATYALWRFATSFDFALASGPALFGLILLALLAYYVLRLAILHLGPWIIGHSGLGHRLWMHEQYPARVVWMPVLVLSILATYLEGAAAGYGLWLSVGILVAGWIYSRARIGVVFARSRYRGLYYFLYLCGLEIPPLLVLILELGRNGGFSI